MKIDAEQGGDSNFYASAYRMINDLRLRMETSYRRGECIGSSFYVSLWRRLCAFEKYTRGSDARTENISFGSRSVLHCVALRRAESSRITCLAKLLMRSVLREATDYKALFIFE